MCTLLEYDKLYLWTVVWFSVAAVLARQLNFSLKYISHASSEANAMSFILCVACCSHSVFRS